MLNILAYSLLAAGIEIVRVHLDDAAATNCLVIYVMLSVFASVSCSVSCEFTVS